MIKECLENVRKNVPLVHNITNYVTVNDVANVILACGGSPIMSDDEGDVEDITSICGGLNINIGTLNKNTIPSMYLAGKKANELGHVVLLDPVGAGASKLRTDTAVGLMKEIRFDVIRGNAIVAVARVVLHRTGLDRFCQPARALGRVFCQLLCQQLSACLHSRRASPFNVFRGLVDFLHFCRNAHRRKCCHAMPPRLGSLCISDAKNPACSPDD